MKINKNKSIGIITIVSIIIGFALGTAFQNKTQYISFNFHNATQSEVSVQSANAAPKLPIKLDFAGENVPINQSDIRERLDLELITNSYRHSSTILLIKRANQWESMMRKILKQQGVPEDFVYLCMAESNLDQVTSPSNASGFWQFLKGTATQYGLIVNDEVDERFDIEKSTYAACRYLKDAYEKTGSWTMAAAGYNRGVGGILRDGEFQKSQNFYDLYLNKETSRYIFRILALKLIIQNPTDFNFHIEASDLYPAYNYRIVAVDGAVNSWVDFAIQNGTNYKELKKHNPWMISSSLKNVKQNHFEVKIPLND
ncbi:MAG: lytic transglycosylase domain-containing protein [Chitinophagales bacterium]|nr:lytic transglycosylase domain-containing protein [Chitinophagales bacterium]